MATAPSAHLLVEPAVSATPASPDVPTEPPTSVAVRRFLVARGIREHNHASEIARIIEVDRSQSYRRLKGDVGWSPADLRAIALRFGAPEDALLPCDGLNSPVGSAAPATATAVPATIRVAGLPSTGLLVLGAELADTDRADLVAVKAASGTGWDVHLDGEQPADARRHAVEALTLRSPPYLQVALLEDDAHAAAALAEAFRPLGIAVEAFADGMALMAAILRRRFDAFVLDWLLREGTAAQVVEQVRLHRPQVPIVVVTGALGVDAALEHQLLALSARWNFSTLDKPVRPMNLANALKQLVNAARD